jgi:hypothetical protein
MEYLHTKGDTTRNKALNALRTNLDKHAAREHVAIHERSSPINSVKRVNRVTYGGCSIGHACHRPADHQREEVNNRVNGVSKGETGNVGSKNVNHVPAREKSGENGINALRA